MKTAFHIVDATTNEVISEQATGRRWVQHWGWLQYCTIESGWCICYFWRRRRDRSRVGEDGRRNNENICVSEKFHLMKTQCLCVQRFNYILEDTETTGMMLSAKWCLRKERMKKIANTLKNIFVYIKSKLISSLLN